LIRDAKNVDIPSIVDLLRGIHRRSHYADTAALEESILKQLLVRAIQRHKHTNEGGFFVQVSVDDLDMVHGLVLGVLERSYIILNRLRATDVFWVADRLVDPRDPKQLMRNMVDWAWSSPYCIEVQCAVTGVIDTNRKGGKVLSRIGMQRYGEVYRMERPK
jgi:hypothetical protein